MGREGGIGRERDGVEREREGREGVVRERDRQTELHLFLILWTKTFRGRRHAL